ncbi:LacI family transcriptional regulator [Bifidobacterium saguini DSM 23967]|uniref:LacI family transcriptional regulator n=2 Tax=Bifidobacterium saguini TaxID=762210 RepID=A0A087DFB3_9BIFI|nr:LacI family DNA-binding transcriptional regulator [Bifidobacterium saguini]KFI94213.1 LacI family transcriptional regulator [Bifidobacterium saguini DSM 23967]QTB90503.1 LacI family DNA-binding transcriptional regulator [Bifidobacterium saguini]
MVTMKEIAKQAGVSVSTVSLVLNNRDEGRVRDTVANQVRAIASQLGYKSNPLASSLRTGRTHILGFISEDVATTPYAGGMILGAQRAAQQLGYMLIVVSTEGPKNEAEEIEALKRYGTDGFLYAKMSNRMATMPEALKDTPLVLVDATDEAGMTPSVEPDEFRIGYDATQRLINAGCQRIAYVGAEDPIIAEQGRMAGYRAALAEADMAFDGHLVAHVGNNEPALAAVNALFDTAQPDGFFCFNDARAWYVYECAARRGLTIGHDISVIGVDNHRVFADTLVPQLTTVELPHFEMGYWAASKLVSIIEESSLADMEWPDTTAPLPPIKSPIPAAIHCTLIEKGSVRH